MKIIINTKLVMWEKTEMPESVMEKDEAGKTVFRKTGKKVENSTYHFRDEFGDKLSFMSPNNNYRNLEGQDIELELEIGYDDFKRKNKMSLVSVSPVD